MKFAFEVLTNPGDNAKFLAEMRIEKNEKVWGPDGWWGLWLTFWLYPGRRWREWLWGHTNEPEKDSHVWQVRLCGCEITWQTTAKRRGGYT